MEITISLWKSITIEASGSLPAILDISLLQYVLLDESIIANLAHLNSIKLFRLHFFISKIFCPDNLIQENIHCENNKFNEQIRNIFDRIFNFQDLDKSLTISTCLPSLAASTGLRPFFGPILTIAFLSAFL